MQALPSNRDQQNLPALPNFPIDKVVERLELLQQNLEKLRLETPAFRFHHRGFHDDPDDSFDEEDTTSTEEGTTESELSSDEEEKIELLYRKETEKMDKMLTSRSRSPLSELPAELIVRILSFVGMACGPPGLRAMALTCKSLWEIVEDPGMDKYIWRACASSIVAPNSTEIPPFTFAGTRVFPSKVQTSEGPVWRCLWNTLAQNSYMVHEPFPTKLHHPLTTNMLTSYTSPGGPFPRPREEPHEFRNKDGFWHASLPRNEKAAQTSLPPISKDGEGRKVKRVFDFVHSATEASRMEYGIAFVGVKTCGWSDSIPVEWKEKECQGYTLSDEERETTTNWILFTDDPKTFPEAIDDNALTVQRAALIGGFTGGESECGTRASLTLENPGKLFEGEENARIQHVREHSPDTHEQPSGHQSLPLPNSPKQTYTKFFKAVDEDRALHAKQFGPRMESLAASIYNAVGPGPENLISKPIDVFTNSKLAWTMSNVCDVGLIGFGKSIAHSDSNLRLVPRLVRRQLEVDAVQRLALPINGKVGANMEWKMPASTKELSLAFRTPEEEAQEEDVWDEEFADTRVTWEFRSCGDKLIVCDDNSGRTESTVSCFLGRTPSSLGGEDERQDSKVKGEQAAERPSDLIWQRRMYIRGATPIDDYFLDNDGLAMNSTVVAYATRRHVFPANPRGIQSTERFRAVMEFHILSLRTGETIKILNLSQEERFIEPRCYMWCSFVLGDNALFASIAGQEILEERRDEDNGVWRGGKEWYGYDNIFVWDLGEEGHLKKAGFNEGEGREEKEIQYVEPYSKIPLSWGWSGLDKYLTLSCDGRWLGVSAEWGMAVWDVVKKRFEGTWRVEGVNQMSRDHASWNGVWIKYRDIIVPSPSPPPPITSGSSSKNDIGSSNSSNKEEVLRDDICFILNKDLRLLVSGVEERPSFQPMDRFPIPGYDLESIGNGSEEDEEDEEEDLYSTEGNYLDNYDEDGDEDEDEEGDVSDEKFLFLL